MLYIVWGCGRHPRIDARIIAVSAPGIPVQMTGVLATFSNVDKWNKKSKIFKIFYFLLMAMDEFYTWWHGNMYLSFG